MTNALLSSTADFALPDKKNTYQGKLISENFPNGLFTVDHQWAVKSWNIAAGELLGVKAADIIGKNLWETFAGNIPLTFYNAYHQSFLQNIPVYFEGYWQQRETWYEAITCYSEGILAVSFKKKHPLVYEPPVQQLKVLHELYQFVTLVTNDCLWEWDFRNKAMFWIDGGHKRVFGYPVENAVIPQQFWEVRIHPHDKDRILTSLHKIITEGLATTWEDEYRFKKANGDYAYVHDCGHIIYDDNKASRMIGATQDITAKKLAQKQLLSTETKLIQERLTRQKEITNAVLTAQENERMGIGKELHDNLNQVLGAAKLYIEMAKADETISAMCLEKSSAYIVQVIEEIRKIAKSLVPQIMIMGLEDSIKNLLFDLHLTHPLKIDFQEEAPEEPPLDEKLQMAIFRIIQEQLNNIIKHSKATHATISLNRKGGDLILLMSDNGQGCDTTKGTEGIGLRNIISRAELYHGSVAIESTPGEGFTLKALIPLQVHP